MDAPVQNWRGLYAIIDPAACAARDPLFVAREVLAGGCAVLQLRHKHGSDDAVVELGLALARLCERAGVPFVLNDRAELAERVGARGLHLGQGDVPLAAARTLLPRTLLGMSTHDLAQARDAQAQGADLIGFGPVFATQSKDKPDPLVGLDGLRNVLASVRIPVVAIGGIDAATIAAVAATGVPLAAVIGAICRSDTPGRAAEQLHGALLAHTGAPTYT